MIEKQDTYEQMTLFDIDWSGAVALLQEDDDYDRIGPIFLLAGSCVACASGIHTECRNDVEDASVCCCASESDSSATQFDTFGDSPAKERPDVISQIKAANEVTDVTSTGRKRAALAYPIEEGMICEWSHLKSSGGGVKPVIGCAGNEATDRHHGPDKNTLNNTEGNVHRICVDCHNRWHAANDQYYGKRTPGTEPFIPLDGNTWTQHDPNGELATDEEIVQNEIYWRTKNKKKEN